MCDINHDERTVWEKEFHVTEYVLTLSSYDFIVSGHVTCHVTLQAGSSADDAESGDGRASQTHFPRRVHLR